MADAANSASASASTGPSQDAQDSAAKMQQSAEDFKYIMAVSQQITAEMGMKQAEATTVQTAAGGAKQASARS